MLFLCLLNIFLSFRLICLGILYIFGCVCELLVNFIHETHAHVCSASLLHSVNIFAFVYVHKTSFIGWALDTCLSIGDRED